MGYLLPSRLGALYDRKRNNNLNLLRVVAATSVLLSHSYQVTLGHEGVPGLAWLLGSVSVWIFFAVSGFLIAASFEHSRSTLDFLVARVLRIFPALMVCVFITALVMGPLVTDRSVLLYFSDPQTYNYVLKNISLFWEMQPLPGVFTDHPVDHTQITFWSLKHEMICYMGVLVFGVLGIYKTKRNFIFFIITFMVIWTLVLQVELNDNNALPSAIFSFRRVSIFFILGMVCYVYRNYIYLSGLVAFSLIPVTVSLWWTPVYHILMPVCVTYFALWLAFVPKGPILAYNRLGDYSYGIYIFAIPIQQLVYRVLGDHSPIENFGYAIFPTLICAVLSWKYIENPAIRSRKSMTLWLQQWKFIKLIK